MAGAKLSFRVGQGGLPLVRVETEMSTADVYLHGAHVTHFQRHEEQPILFLSRASWFEAGKPIRGGVPIILPWFGPREGQPAHGFVRSEPWQLVEASLAETEGARLRFRLPTLPAMADWPRFVAKFEVFVGHTLDVELTVTNVDDTRPLPLETCLHTYFAVGDIAQTEVRGLRGVKYLDNLEGLREKVETQDAIRFDGEVDRVYVNTTETTEIVDRAWNRIIEVAKSDSLSTVVWNPWIAKAQRMPDYGDDEYLRMVCVESGNVKANALQLQPGQSATLAVAIDSREL
jgi:glucose-6-phosphate 1-epimerase